MNNTEKWVKIDDPVEYMNAIEERIGVIKSVLDRNYRVYDQKTLQYCLNTLTRPAIKRGENNADIDTQAN